jgi:hypothetical protein
MNAIANKRVGAGAGMGAGSGNGQKILLGSLCVILVLVLVWQVPKLLGGSGSPSVATEGDAVATAAATQTASGAPAIAATPASLARERQTARLIKRLPARDPFLPLAGAVPAATSPAATSPAATSPAATGPATTPAPAPTPQPTVPKPVAVPKVVPTAAVIWIDGQRQVVGLKQTFKVGDTTFRLSSVTKTTATITPVSGALEGGKSQIKLTRTKPVTLENTATGVKYTLRFSLAMSKVPTSDGK